MAATCSEPTSSGHVASPLPASFLFFNSISIIFSSYNKQPAPAIITADTLYFQIQNCQIFFKISDSFGSEEKH